VGTVNKEMVKFKNIFKASIEMVKKSTLLKTEITSGTKRYLTALSALGA
jgi:hypothetical protein